MIRKSTEEDLMMLTEISKNSFDTDVSVGGQKNEGPPEYDSYEWHKKMMLDNHLYTYVNNSEIVGGAILFKNTSDLFVGRIFISPKFFRQGLEMMLMQDVENYFPDVKRVNLDTPVWNVRTNSFYHKCGYDETKRDEESVYYERKLNG